MDKVLLKVFRELDIEYRLLPLDVNVRGMPSLTSDKLPSNWTTLLRRQQVNILHVRHRHFQTKTCSTGMMDEGSLEYMIDEK
ncbi:hypothetical protein ACFX2I_016009 [Malus domestica]